MHRQPTSTFHRGNAPDGGANVGSSGGSSTNASLTNLRQQLSSSNYDISAFLEPRIESLTGKDHEKQLLALFTELSVGVTKMSHTLANEMVNLHAEAQEADEVLFAELDSHSSHLDEVEISVDAVIDQFHKASEGALRIGEQLAVSEHERLRIEMTVEIMECVTMFEDESEKYNNMHTMNVEQIRESLPPQWKNKGWGEISKILHNLKKILFDINSEDVQNAQRNVVKLAEAVEAELLYEFEIAVLNLMDDTEDVGKIKTANDLATWLHLYNNGHSLQKRYIFSVVERRLPNYEEQTVTGKTSPGKVKQRKILRDANLHRHMKHHGHKEFSDDDNSGSSESESDSESSSGASASGADSDADAGAVVAGGRSAMGHLKHRGSSDTSNNMSSSADSLSVLFGTIGSLCAEQFDIIQKVFPQSAVARVTRLLIQRIFNDPAFGIQARVEQLLRPRPPRPQLLLADYLDCLLTVCEKLVALDCVLTDHCVSTTQTYLALKQLKSRGTSKTITRQLSAPTAPVGLKMSQYNDSVNSSASAVDDSNDEESRKMTLEHTKAVDEIKAFLQEQITQVVVPYLPDYFEKEMLLLKISLVDSMRNCLSGGHNATAGDSAAIALPPGLMFNTNGTVCSVSAGNSSTGNNTMANRSSVSGPNYPRLKMEKVRAVSQLAASIANLKFLDSIQVHTTNSVVRMQRIGKDDKRQPDVVRDVAIFEVSYIVDGLMIPWLRACIHLLLRHYNISNNTSAMSSVVGRSAPIEMPPLEYLDVLVAVHSGLSKVKFNFLRTYMKVLKNLPNAIMVYKEHKRKLLKSVDTFTKESLYIWTLGVSSNVDRYLATLNNKSIYNPTAGGKDATRGNINSTSPACMQISKTVSLVATQMDARQAEMPGLSLSTLFWKPLGQEVVAAMISHLRKQKITPEGAEMLIRDMNEYCTVLSKCAPPDVFDSMLCLREMCQIFLVPPELVVMMVSEEFRHLDTNIVLALSKARSDFNSTSIGFSGNSINYAKELSVMYAFFKWDESLYWENHKKQLTASELSEAVLSSSSRGPTTLRKSNGATINMLFIDMAKQKLPSLRYTKAFADSTAGPSPLKKKFSMNLSGMGESSFLVQQSTPSSSGWTPDKPRSFHNSSSTKSDSGNGNNSSRENSAASSSVADISGGSASVPVPPEAPTLTAGSGRSWSSFLSSTAGAAASATAAAAKLAVENANVAMATYNESKAASSAARDAAASAPERPSLTKKFSTRFW